MEQSCLQQSPIFVCIQNSTPDVNFIISAMLVQLALILATLARTHCDINFTVGISAEDVTTEYGLKGSGLSMEVHRKIYSFTQNSTAFKNFTFEDTVAFMNELYAWESPRDIQEAFPYAHWGYDYEKRPVWSQEIGRQDWRSIVEQGEERVSVLEKYLLQSLIHVVKSLVAVDTPGDEIRQGVFIWDMDGFSIRQLTYLPSVVLGLQMGRKYGDLPRELLGLGLGINANYPTKLALDIGRPIFGGYLSRIELYGSNRNVWLPRLLKLMPIDSIPPQYGGPKKFKPLGVYG